MRRSLRSLGSSWFGLRWNGLDGDNADCDGDGGDGGDDGLLF